MMRIRTMYVTGKVPNNIIKYKAPQKLNINNEVKANTGSGRTYKTFGDANIISHTFNKDVDAVYGVGTIVCDADVTAIGPWAFAYCYDLLIGITIPSSVTSIGELSFYNCGNFEEIYISDLVAWCNVSFNYSPFNYSGGGHIYLNDEEITELVIPNSVTSIGTYAFFNCDSLTSVTIPSSVTSIGEHAFRGCSGITSINIDSNNTVYDSRNNCNAIIKTAENELVLGCNNTVIPNTVTSIGSEAFQNCSGLTSINIPNSVTSIGNSAFNGCSGLTSIIIPNSVTSIGNSAFSGCRGLTSITIPNSVTSIGDRAFYHCSGLTSITIPNSVTSIGEWAFYNCSGLTEVNYNATNCTSMGSSSFPVFYQCTSLATLSIGNNVQRIPSYAFYKFSGLSSVTIGSSVTDIGNYSFQYCSSLTSVTIPDSVTSIGTSAFRNCDSLTEVNFNTNNVSSSTSTSAKFGPSSSPATLRIGNNVTSVPNIFSGWGGLTKVIIGNSVNSFGRLTFSSCTNLTEIDYNATSCESAQIGTYAVFKGCTAVTTINIGSNVTSIPARMFIGCGGVTSIISLATTAPTIKNTTFQGVGSDGTLYVPSGSSGYDAWMRTSNYYLGSTNWTKVEQ